MRRYVDPDAGEPEAACFEVLQDHLTKLVDQSSCYRSVRGMRATRACNTIDVKLTVYFLQPALSENTVPEHFASIVSQYGDRNAYVEAPATKSACLWP